MKKHFVFDLDDTLTNSYGFNQQMFVDTFLPTHPDIDQEVVRQVHAASRGKPMLEQFEAVIRQLELKDLDAKELRNQNEQLHVQNYDQIKIFTAIIDLFGRIQEKGKTISICTNRQSESLHKILDTNNLTPYFKHIVSCIDAGHEKPDPKCLLDIVESEGGHPEDFIYIGDSKTDHDFAKNAGVDFIIVDHYLNDQRFYLMLIESFM